MASVKRSVLGVLAGAAVLAPLLALAQAATPAAPETATAATNLLSHQAALEIDGAATGWILTSTALVLLMTLPGLALFYGGMVQRKNVIATVTQSVGTFAVVTVVWVAIAYSLAFGVAEEPVQNFIGGVQAAFLNGVGMTTAYAAAKGLPEYLWVAYQLTFAVITPALVTGAFAERMKYTTLMLFIGLWSIVVYAPICHWVWGGGFLGDMGVLDFAGGAVVHINSGVAGLVCAIVLGPRTGFGREKIVAHNPVLTMVGASLLLVGWIGFNAGSAWAADAIAAVALLNTLVAAAAGAIGWKVIEWIEHKKPTLIGLLSGLVAGLVGITPAAGFVDPKGALIIGLISGPACYAAVFWLKRLLRYDDSLDAFGIHGVGGLVGAVLTGVFATTAVNSVSEGADVVKQLIGVGATIAWSAAATFAVLMVCRLVTGLRVKPEHEAEGLDVVLHGEALPQ